MVRRQADHSADNVKMAGGDLRGDGVGGGAAIERNGPRALRPRIRRQYCAAEKQEECRADSHETFHSRRPSRNAKRRISSTGEEKQPCPENDSRQCGIDALTLLP